MERAGLAAADIACSARDGSVRCSGPATAATFVVAAGARDVLRRGRLSGDPNGCDARDASALGAGGSTPSRVARLMIVDGLFGESARLPATHRWSIRQPFRIPILALDVPAARCRYHRADRPSRRRDRDLHRIGSC
jgi:hypothetical protein